MEARARARERERRAAGPFALALPFLLRSATGACCSRSFSSRGRAPWRRGAWWGPCLALGRERGERGTPSTLGERTERSARAARARARGALRARRLRVQLQVLGAPALIYDSSNENSRVVSSPSPSGQSHSPPRPSAAPRASPSPPSLPLRRRSVWGLVPREARRRGDACGGCDREPRSASRPSAARRTAVEPQQPQPPTPSCPDGQSPRRGRAWVSCPQPAAHLDARLLEVVGQGARAL